MLYGQLDLAVADQLTRRIAELVREQRPIRIDLARLEFMDSTGLRALIMALMESRRDAFRLQIGAEASYQVRRVIELAGVRGLFWPDGRSQTA
jgi:anti-anti-sigma factor